MIVLTPKLFNLLHIDLIMVMIIITCGLILIYFELEELQLFFYLLLAELFLSKLSQILVSLR